MQVGVVGLGAVGRAICATLDTGVEGLVLVGATARDRAKGEGFLRTLRSPRPYMTVDALIEASDLVIEASTQASLRELAPKTLSAGKQLLVMSCGGLLEHPEWVDLARSKGTRILVPSGAMAALDALKGARVGRLDHVTLETRKPPRALAGAPYIEEQGIDLESLREETLVFEGPAAEACRAFPANVNVLAALSLAGVGPDLTRIRLFAVPGLERNVHRVTVSGEFGRISLEIENEPSENPKTGKLTYFSAIAMLRELNSPLRVGT